MLQNDTFILSKRGWLITAVTGTIFLFFTVTGLHLFQFVSGAALLSILAIFRNPERNSPVNEPGVILSGVDGVVLSVEETMVDERKMTKVTVLNSLWDVSMLRSPFNATIEGAKIRHGVSLPLYNPLAESLNEKAVISFRAHSGEEVYVEHISEKSCFPIAIDADVSQRLKEGGRYGFLAKGRSALYLPEGTRVAVNPGMSVRAGESPIGFFQAA